MDETSAPAPAGKGDRAMTGRTMAFYFVMLAAAAALFVVSIFVGSVGDTIVAVPVMVIIVSTMVLDKRVIHIPPVMIAFLISLMFLGVAGKVLGGGTLLNLAGDLIVGVALGLCGIMTVYIFTKSLPGARNETPALVSAFSFCFGLAAFALWKATEFYMNRAFGLFETESYESMMSEIVLVGVGAAFVSILYYENKHMGLFQHTVDRFLEPNYDTIGMKRTDQEEVLTLAREGESDRLEFKSTLRTNLQTGDRDKRMEKAVLKTVVAFLNTDGGTLLVGVSDDGTVTGVDEHDFDSRDRLNLHFTNLISSQIGNEFLPCIGFDLVDFGEKAVLRVECGRCDRPVFLKEGGNEIFFVRSGPSSVELTGMDLINYVNNRRRNGRWLKRV